MSKSIYDFVFVTNIPAFYKTPIYNELSKRKKIFVIYISSTSNIRNEDFFFGEKKFDHKIISNKSYESRKKVASLFKIVKLLLSIDFKKIVFSGWESKELAMLLFFIPKKKNQMIIESSIFDSKVSGISGFIKRQILSRVSFCYPSGVLQKELIDELNYQGDFSYTHGVGIFKRPNYIDDRSIIPGFFKYLYVGRLSEEKNLSYLIDEFNKNKKSLTIVGDGNLKSQLMKQANDNIEFTGHVDNKELAGFYTSHDVFILPSKSEPWGLVIEEALWFGLPVLTSENIGCNSDLVIPYNTGIVFDYSSLTSSIFEVERSYQVYRDNIKRVDFEERDKKQIDVYL